MSRKRQQKHADDIYELKGSQVLCIVRGIASANMVECWDGISDGTIVAELPPRFRKTLWIRRGSYVVVTLFENPAKDATIKMQGEIASVLQADQIKRWKKNGTWPSHFEHKSANTTQLAEDKDDEGNAFDDSININPPSKSEGVVNPDDDDDDYDDAPDIPPNPNRR